MRHGQVLITDGRKGWFFFFMLLILICIGVTRSGHFLYGL